MLFEGLLPWLDHARRHLRRLPFIRSEGGAVAVEFAIIALPFVFAVFSVFELALILLIYSTLENGMGDAARTIRTGTLQNSGTATASA
ncbi:TadE/TadG family type IV pilus assembly protein, partial [Acinetobacter baumannii]